MFVVPTNLVVVSHQNLDCLRHPGQDSDSNLVVFMK